VGIPRPGGHARPTGAPAAAAWQLTHELAAIFAGGCLGAVACAELGGAIEPASASTCASSSGRTFSGTPICSSRGF